MTASTRNLPSLTFFEDWDDETPGMVLSLAQYIVTASMSLCLITHSHLAKLGILLSSNRLDNTIYYLESQNAAAILHSGCKYSTIDKQTLTNQKSTMKLQRWKVWYSVGSVVPTHIFSIFTNWKYFGVNKWLLI